MFRPTAGARNLLAPVAAVDRGAVGSVTSRKQPERGSALASFSFQAHTVAGCSVNVMRGGSGPPLLFLHGAGGAGIWLPFMDRLAGRYDVIVPDHPGFGRSDKPAWLDDMSDLAFFYLDFMEALGLEKLHLMGSSLGGWLAAEIAMLGSSRLRTLTLVAAAGLNIPGVRQGDIFLWSPEQRVRNLFVDQRLADQRLAMALSEEQVDIALKNELATADLAWHPRFHHPRVRKWIHRIAVPTLIVWGDSDKIFPVPYGEEYRRLIAGSRLVVVPGCGHLPQVEKADAFVDLFIRFVEEEGA
jgi:pimeloyl-ACP methyl ester carboxylesterase